MKNTYRKPSSTNGFTIVELLIVIVIIAILAAITIVAYNGVQARAKSSSAQALANSVLKKAEAFNSIQNGYPTNCQLATNTTNATGTATGIGTAGCTAGATASPSEATIPDPTKLNAAGPTDEKTVEYQMCNSNKGYKVMWWDATKASGSNLQTISGGDTTAGTCSN